LIVGPERHTGAPSGRNKSRMKPHLQTVETCLIRHFLNPPNWFTSASIFCSIYAMGLVVGVSDIGPKTLSLACIMVIFGTVFDLLDGRVARMTNRFTEFGVQLDSLADLVGFGVAPALLVYAWTLHSLGTLGIVVCFWFVLCAAFRLARFNVNTTHRVWTLKGHSQGVTSTMAGFCIVSFMWTMNAGLLDVGSVSAPTVAVLVATLGLLMISSVPFRNFRDIRQNKRARLMMSMGMGVTLTAGVIVDASVFFGAAAAIYLCVGIADGLITTLHFKHTGHPLFEELIVQKDE
jgi:CDP-diacylglycerol--serine O-phosphatidyltransferase